MAAISGATVAAYFSLGGYIEAGSATRDLVIYGLVLVALVIGVTLDSLFNLTFGRIVLWVASFAVVIIFALSFLSFLAPSALFAITASALAVVRRYGQPTSQMI
jgi:uncharacterized membrane protein YoaK (UPF0700 family)